ncbi:MAG: RNA-metabolising metallo-beta-lactamase family protein [Parcubacteria group bacterium GW2011_GWA1_56_13]|nr:MAG: RNA-metabolising metallo-beta-lactamase family protein [Parcubacteria group bacterium GW2011_GWA1_56_13]
MSQSNRVPRAADYFPEPAGPTTVRIIPLGGVEEVGRNMTAVEVGATGDILVFDAGFQFVSEDTSPGVDYILPNTKYLEKNADRVKGVIITHGHLDHIGGIPFTLPRFGTPPLYTQNLTGIMIQRRQEEYPDVPKSEIHTVEVGQSVTIGSTRVKFFPVTHSIPDSMGVSVETPQGNVVITGDLKLDHDDGVPAEHEVKTWGTIGKDKNIFFIADSTNAEKDGFSIPEKRVIQTLEEIIKTVSGRLIIGTFASQFERMIHIMEAAEKLGKKIVTEGRSIRNNLEIAEKTGLLKIKKETIIPAQDIGNYPPDKIVILSTGAQGEEFAALMRIATEQHKNITLNERDTIVLSSSVIPGNEIAVQKLKDNLYRHGVTLIHYRSSDVHSTGHGNTGELVWINKQVGATFFMPAYGYHSMLRCHAKAVEQSGFPKENIIVPDNGTVIDIENGERMNVHKQKVPSAPMVVDGFTIGDIQEVVIRDRQSLAKDGMFVIIASVALKTGKLRKSPDIISRGFIYLRESQNLLNEARVLIKKTIEDSTRNMNPIDLDYVKNNLTDVIAGFLFARTNKAPMVIPVLIGM